MSLENGKAVSDDARCELATSNLKAGVARLGRIQVASNTYGKAFEIVNRRKRWKRTHSADAMDRSHEWGAAEFAHGFQSMGRLV